MTFFKKIFYSTFVAVIILGGVNITSGQETDQNPSTKLIRPEIFITDITLERKSYMPDEKVSGTFVVHNVSNFDVNDIKYVISFVSEYDEGDIPAIILNSSDRIDFPSLVRNSKQTIQFSYLIPKIAGGSNPGINIQAYMANGGALGWGDSKINLTSKGLPILYLNNIKLNVLDQEFAIYTGPTVYPGDKAFLDLSVKNTFGNINLTPKISVREEFSGTLVYSKNLQGVKSGLGTLTYELPLIVNELKPGVYLATLELLDINNVNRLPPVEFRYIVGGQIGKIQSLYTDTRSVKKGKNILVRAGITGTPMDIVRFKLDEGSPNASLEISVIDRTTSEMIGNQSIDVSNLTEETVDLNIKVNKNSNQITLNAVLYGSDGKTLDTYSLNIPTNEEIAVSKTSLTTMGLITALILLIIIFWVIKNNIKNRSKKIILMIALVIFIAMGLLVGSNINYLKAATEVYSGGGIGVREGATHYSYTPQTVLVNSPLPPTVHKYAPGERFNVQMNFSAAACNNGPQYISLITLKKSQWWDYSVMSNSMFSVNSLSNNDSNNRGVWENNNGSATFIAWTDSRPSYGDHNDSNRSFISAGVSGYYAPDEPGTYTMYFYIINKNIWSDGTTHWGWNLSYVNIEVVEPTTLFATTSSDCGGKINLSWVYDGHHIDYYKIFKNESQIATTTNTSYETTASASDIFYVKGFREDSVLTFSNWKFVWKTVQVEVFSSNSVSATPSTSCGTVGCNSGVCSPGGPFNGSSATASFSSATPSCSGVTLSWPLVSGADGYYLYRGINSTSLSPINENNLISSSTVQITDSVSSGTYVYGIAAHFTGQTGVGTLTNQATTSPVTVPDPTCVIPSCGANAQNYMNSETNPPSNWNLTESYCSNGIPQNTPSYPNPGETAQWTCTRTDGSGTTPCSASRLSPVNCSISQIRNGVTYSNPIFINNSVTLGVDTATTATHPINTFNYNWYEISSNNNATLVGSGTSLNKILFTTIGQKNITLEIKNGTGETVAACSTTTSVILGDDNIKEE